MLRTSAPATAAISATSSGACAMTGRAPIASVALAVSFMTTKLVIWCTSGRCARRRRSDSPVRTTTAPATSPLMRCAPRAPALGRARLRTSSTSTGPSPPPTSSSPQATALAATSAATRAASRSGQPCASSAASVAECVHPAPWVAATRWRGTGISTWSVPSKRWSTGSLPWPPVTMAAAAPIAQRRSASWRRLPVEPVSISASGRFGVTTVASGKSRDTSTVTASSSRRRAPELATITGSTTSGTSRPAERRGDCLDDLRGEQHPGLDRISADVVEHRGDLGGHERRRARSGWR